MDVSTIKPICIGILRSYTTTSHNTASVQKQHVSIYLSKTENIIKIFSQKPKFCVGNLISTHAKVLYTLLGKPSSSTTIAPVGGWTPGQETPLLLIETLLVPHLDLTLPPTINILLFCLPAHISSLYTFLLPIKEDISEPTNYTPSLHLGCEVQYPFSTQLDGSLIHIQELLSIKFSHPASMAQPQHLKTRLLPHQIQALAFMLLQERRTETYLWRCCGDLTWENELSGRVTNTLPKSILLADDMGLGKTVSTIALIVSTLNEAAEFSRLQNPSSSTKKVKATLIVVPSTLLKQWEHKILQHTDPDLMIKVIIHHGKGRSENFISFYEADIVLTSYHIMINDLGSLEKEGLFHVRWFCVILDEAQ